MAGSNKDVFSFQKNMIIFTRGDVFKKKQINFAISVKFAKFLYLTFLRAVFEKSLDHHCSCAFLYYLNVVT